MQSKSILDYSFESNSLEVMEVLGFDLLPMVHMQEISAWLTW
jgi:hypothetical protein